MSAASLSANDNYVVRVLVRVFMVKYDRRWNTRICRRRRRRRNILYERYYGKHDDAMTKKKKKHYEAILVDLYGVLFESHRARLFFVT